MKSLQKLDQSKSCEMPVEQACKPRSYTDDDVDDAGCGWCSSCCWFCYPGTGSGSCSLIVLAHSDLVKLVTFLTIEKNIPNNNSGFNKELEGSPFAILAMFLASQDALEVMRVTN